jgi:hypothetical protein
VKPGLIGVPHALLLAGTAVGVHMSAEQTLAALAEGVVRAGRPQPDVCPLPAPRAGAPLPELLAAAGFDERMRAARALVVCERSLSPHTLAASVTFELATRARQAGVPAFAVARSSSLGTFEARILDLQAIELARDAVSLRDAGARLAALADGEAAGGEAPRRAVRTPQRPPGALTSGTRRTST